VPIAFSHTLMHCHGNFSIVGNYHMFCQSQILLLSWSVTETTHNAVSPSYGNEPYNEVQRDTLLFCTTLRVTFYYQQHL
jgi:hypothetical protein